MEGCFNLLFWRAVSVSSQNGCFHVIYRLLFQDPLTQVFQGYLMAVSRSSSGGGFKVFQRAAASK
jgi:hypothetical protein